MLAIDLKQLPTGEELPDSDDTPVDNEEQNFIPNFLLFLLEYLWADRMDWCFSSDMAVYHTTGTNPRVPVVPDGFLSIGVERRKLSGARRSYVIWEENNVVPIMTLEVVSHTPGSEYDLKQNLYAKLGVKYYVIYNPNFWRRDGHLPFEIYELVNATYQLQTSEPFWMPEVGLGIGRCELPSDVLGREVLSWFDQNGDRCLSEAEILRERAVLDQSNQLVAQQKIESLMARLRELGEELD